MSYRFPKANIHQHIKEGCNVIVTWFRGWFFFFSLFPFCCKLVKCELNNLISTKINWIQIKIYCCSFCKRKINCVVWGNFHFISFSFTLHLMFYNDFWWGGILVKRNKIYCLKQKFKGGFNGDIYYNLKENCPWLPLNLFVSHLNFFDFSYFSNRRGMGNIQPLKKRILNFTFTICSIKQN